MIHSEIKPYGARTRRFILGKHTELPQKVKKTISLLEVINKNILMCLPLEFEEWLDKFS